jgi:hypothetical protein
MSTDSFDRVERCLETADRHHRNARLWSLLLVGLAVLVVLGLLLRPLGLMDRGSRSPHHRAADEPPG